MGTHLSCPLTFQWHGNFSVSHGLLSNDVTYKTRMTVSQSLGSVTCKPIHEGWHLHFSHGSLCHLTPLILGYVEPKKKVNRWNICTLSYWIAILARDTSIKNWRNKVGEEAGDFSLLLCYIFGTKWDWFRLHSPLYLVYYSVQQIIHIKKTITNYPQLCPV